MSCTSSGRRRRIPGVRRGKDRRLRRVPDSSSDLKEAQNTQFWRNYKFTIQGKKSDEIYPFSTVIFWQNFVKGTGATYKKPLMCGFKDGGQVIIPDYLEFSESNTTNLVRERLNGTSEGISVSLSRSSPGPRACCRISAMSRDSGSCDELLRETRPGIGVPGRVISLSPELLLDAMFVDSSRWGFEGLSTSG
jgi:hypothetical protein